jgi:hypothetical protein
MGRLAACEDAAVILRVGVAPRGVAGGIRGDVRV